MICDLAEYYHVYNYRELPVDLLATLITGLRADSRTVIKLSGEKMPQDITLLAAIVDRLSILVWAKSKDAAKGKNKPKLILEEINKPKKQKDIVAFNDGKDFDKERKRLLAKINK